MAPVQLTLKQMELAKMRVVKVLRINEQDSYISALTTYPAIAAINSKMTTSKALVGSSTIDTTITGYNSSPTAANCLYVPGTTPAGAIGSLQNILDTDPGLFKIITSKPYMLLFTNNTSGVGNGLTAYDHAGGTGYPYDVKQTVGGVTAYTKSLQLYVNYLAATSTMCGGAANNGSTTTAIGTNYAALYADAKCIIGEGDTSGCTLTSWNNTQISSLLSFNTLCGNVGQTAANGYFFKSANTFAFTGIATDFTTYIKGLNTNSSVNGGWDLFDYTYTGIASALQKNGKNGTARDAFLKMYNSLDFSRAVIPADFTAFHEKIYTIDALSHVKQILAGPNSQLIQKLVNEGIMTFTQANNDYVDVANATYSFAFLDGPNLSAWVEKLPVAVTSGHTVWADLAGSTWFYSAAYDPTFSTAIASGKITFKDLISVNTASSANGAPYGYGIYGDDDNSGVNDTYKVFQQKFITNPHAKVFIKAGVPITSFCSGGSAETMYCQVNYTGIGKNMIGALTGANEYASIWDCLFSQEAVELFQSPAAHFWQSPYDLVQDIANSVCV